MLLIVVCSLNICSHLLSSALAKQLLFDTETKNPGIMVCNRLVTENQCISYEALYKYVAECLGT